VGVEKLYQEVGMDDWYQPEAYRIVEERMRKKFAEHEIWISQAGFEP